MQRVLMKPIVQCFPHLSQSNTCVYVVSDPSTKETALIDTVADFNSASCKLQYAHAEELVKYITEEKLSVKYILETHAHADHISGAPFFKQKYNAPLCIGANIKTVQSMFSKVYNDDTIPTDGSPFDKLWEDNEKFLLGEIECYVMYTPGHTPACSTYVIGDAVFSGDTLFHLDMGSARCDFPGGSAEVMWNSLQRILSLPDEFRSFIGHDYPKDRAFNPPITIGDHKKSNKHVKTGTKMEEYVEMRSTRDKNLSMPALLLPSIQCNVRGGDLPEKESNGVNYLKFPVNQF